MLWSIRHNGLAGSIWLILKDRTEPSPSSEDVSVLNWQDSTIAQDFDAAL